MAAASVPVAKRPARGAQASIAADGCQHCAKGLSANDERALFVEEEVGRVFCSESCITAHFGPEIERLEKEYMRRLAPGDLTGDERESLAHLRFITLQEPDEVWREKTLSGDHRYTLISQFAPGDREVYSICICLFLRGEPSFLFIAFTTRNAAMANAYRRGERIEWGGAKGKPGSKGAGKGGAKAKGRAAEPIEADGDSGAVPSASEPSDRLADAWTDDETFLAQMSGERGSDDIPASEYERFQGCLEETLEAPDEVWSFEMSQPEGVRLYHFIRHYERDREDEAPRTGGEPEHWYVILARETDPDGDGEEQLEILDAFPTRDAALVDRYRRGTQEVGESPEQRPVSRLVH